MAKIANKNTNKDIALFENDPVRRIWNEQKEKWYFSVVDIVRVLTDSDNPQVYWRVLKKRLLDEGSNETVTKCNGLKMKALDGKMRETDVADVETLLRLIQSIPSPKAEPFKLWLARVGYERMQEMNDPEIALNRSRGYWQKQGRSEKWIQQRMTGQETRNKLTDYWSENDVKKGDEFAILTNIIHEEWSDLSVKNHKNLKGLKTQNLRDHMSEEELIFSALAELSTRRIAETEKAKGLEANKIPAKKGGKIAKDARIALEEKIGKSVITGQNFLPKLKK
ncbi:MAG: Bro-N domain-containing protein [Candidatus Uhrbacteria bacterium]|nr:Bro-N domain-containing protein [Candidatus Uhrbacteria bacterium]